MSFINLRSMNANKIRTLTQEFNEDLSSYQPMLTVISNGKEIYRRQVKEIDFNRNSNCPKLNSVDKKIINLKDYQIDCSMEPSKQYVNNLFDKIVMFLVSGYMELEEKYFMDILYVLISMEISSKPWMDRLAVSVDKKYYSKLWDVLLLIHNNRLVLYYDLAMKLMDNNHDFLVNQDNQTVISEKFMELESIRELEFFLKNLAHVLTFKGTEEVSAKCFNLVDVLYRYYMFSRNLDSSTYSSKNVLRLMGDRIGVDVIFKLKDVSIEQLFSSLKKMEEEKQVSSLGQTQEKQELKEEIEELKNKIRRHEMDQDRVVEEIKTLQRITNLPGVDLSPSLPGEIVHHPDLHNCESTQSVTLQCGHKNCLNCSYLDIQRFNVKGDIQKYHIRCLKGKDAGSKCVAEWDSERYETLGELLSEFFS